MYALILVQRYLRYIAKRFSELQRALLPFRLFSSLPSYNPDIIAFSNEAQNARDGFLFNVSHRAVIYDAARNKKAITCG